MQAHDAQVSRHAVAAAAAGLLCFAAGFAALVVAPGNWVFLCQDGTFERCLNGHPSFELVFQVVLAAAGFTVTLVMRLFAKRRSYAVAGALLAVAVVLFAAWAVFLDAATHGWDNLKLLWLGVGP